MKKLFTAIVSVLFCVCLTLGFVACTDTSNSSNSGNSSNGGLAGETVLYEITVQNISESPEANITVNLYDSNNTVIANGVTGADGKANISAPAGEYAVGLSNLPSGYSQLTKASYTDLAATPITLVVSSGIPEGVTAPQGHQYAVGNVMYDFSVKLPGGNTFTLSEELKTKDMVLINFWATWCGPCKSEFPAMNEAYEAYSDVVSIIALSTSDSLDTVDDFQKNFKVNDQPNPLTFDMTSDNIGLNDMFNVSSIPVSIVIDRNGVICWMHVGSMTEAKDFTSLFNKYIGDDYVPDYGSVIGGGSNEDVQLEYAKPTEGLVMPSSSAIEAAINNTESGFTFGYSAETGNDKEYSWPWLVSEDGTSIYPSNIDNHYSFATIYSQVTLEAGQALSFDYNINTEPVYDLVYVLIDGVITHELYGSTHGSFRECFAYVAERAGTFEFTLMYYKDTETHEENETVLIKNMRIVDANSVSVGTNILRYGADFAKENWTGTDGKNGIPRFERYANVVLNEADGYYHVDDVNGPLLMADINYPTKWSSSSVYQLAYNDMCIFDIYGTKINFKSEFETYAWIGTHSDNKYVPVSEELKDLLILLTENLGYGYENEWLELCVYYQHYGPADQNVIGDPVKGVHFKTAIVVDIPEGETSVTFKNTITKTLIPRGYRYAFTPKQSGYYSISSLVAPSKTISCDPLAWIFNEKEEQIATSDDTPSKYFYITNENGEKELVTDPNFYFTMYLEANKKYYVVCADFDLYFVGSYDVTIEYLGETVKVMTHCALGPHVFSEDGTQAILPDAIKYTLGDDGYYYAVNSDGTLGSLIYLNVLSPTAFLPTKTIYDVVLQAIEHPGEGFDFSPNGQNYTKDMINYINEAYAAQGSEHGFVKVDEKLMTILKAFMAKYGEGTFSDDAWQLLCHYYMETKN